VKLTGLGLPSQIGFLARFPCAVPRPESWSEAASARTRSASSEGTCKGGGLPGPAGQPLGFPSRRTGRQREHYGAVTTSSNRVGVARATFRVVAGQRRFWSKNAKRRRVDYAAYGRPEGETNNRLVVHEVPVTSPRAALGEGHPASTRASESSATRSANILATPAAPSRDNA